MFSRRKFIACSGLGAIALTVGVSSVISTKRALLSDADAAERFEVTHSDEQWRAILSAEQYQVLRKTF
jgi:peptide-methionine (R)-S-oxide reductase